MVALPQSRYNLLLVSWHPDLSGPCSCLHGWTSPMETTLLMHLDVCAMEELARTDTTLKRDCLACSILRDGVTPHNRGIFVSEDHPIPSDSNPNTSEFGIDPFHPLRSLQPNTWVINMCKACLFVGFLYYCVPHNSPFQLHEAVVSSSISSLTRA